MAAAWGTRPSSTTACCYASGCQVSAAPRRQVCGLRAPGAAGFLRGEPPGCPQPARFPSPLGIQPRPGAKFLPPPYTRWSDTGQEGAGAVPCHAGGKQKCEGPGFLALSWGSWSGEGAPCLRLRAGQAPGLGARGWRHLESVLLGSVLRRGNGNVHPEIPEHGTELGRQSQLAATSLQAVRPAALFPT